MTGVVLWQSWSFLIERARMSEVDRDLTYRAAAAALTEDIKAVRNRAGGSAAMAGRTDGGREEPDRRRCSECSLVITSLIATNLRKPGRCVPWKVEVNCAEALRTTYP